MYSILRDIISPTPPSSFVKEASASSATSSSRSSIASSEETTVMKRTRQEWKGTAEKPDMDEKKRKVGKEEVPVKVVQGRTEKVLECMPEKVIEKIHKMETTRVQPIVHRDRYQVEVHQIVQPIVEKVKKATVLEVKQPITQHLGTRLVEATFTPTLAEGSAIGQVAVAESRSDVVSMVQRTEELPPVIEETVHRKIIEKITPLILVHTTAPPPHDDTIFKGKQNRKKW
jgi:hypothetical protein